MKRKGERPSKLQQQRHWSATSNAIRVLPIFPLAREHSREEGVLPRSIALCRRRRRHHCCEAVPRYTRQWLHTYVLGPTTSSDDDVLDTIRSGCTDASSSPPVLLLICVFRHLRPHIGIVETGAEPLRISFPIDSD